jgi:D-3-phosphoglycerate dehydrogenase
MSSDADVVIVRSPLPDDVFDHARGMLAAIRHGAGVDMIPVQAATREGVMVRQRARREAR